MSTLKTKWSIRLYEVWGNARDGFEVNDSFHVDDVELTLTKIYNNKGTRQAFISAYPSNRQIRKIFGLGKQKLDLQGDDIHIYVYLEKNGYSVGEMFCTSHSSLSPINRVYRP